MEKNFKRTTVTSALPYANGPVHIGHLAGVYVPADIYVRYLRLKKEDVLFIGGSDEHGVPITIRAKKEGITPQDVVDRYHFLIKNHSKNSVSRLTYTAVHHPKHTTNWLQTSSRSYTKKESLSKKLRNNIMMKKHTSFWPTATSPVNVLTVIRKVPMVTNAKSAELHCRPLT